MAKTRMINTRFWNDTFISELDPIEKLLFIYFLSNEHTNICGLYELPLKVVAVETGIESSMLLKIIPRLKEKIIYNKGWVCVKNFISHQSLTSEKTKKGIEIALSAIPSHIKEDAIKNGYSIDGASIGHSSPSGYSDSDSDLKSIAPDGAPPDKPVYDKDTKRFEPPNIDEVRNLFTEKGFSETDGDKFWNFYESKGWMVGKNKMKSWRASVANWLSGKTPTQKKDFVPGRITYT